MRKPYASQESIDSTLTRAEREAPFRLAEADGERLEQPTRVPVLADDTGVIASGLAEICKAMEVRP